MQDDFRLNDELGFLGGVGEAGGEKEDGEEAAHGLHGSLCVQTQRDLFFAHAVGAVMIG